MKRQYDVYENNVLVSTLRDDSTMDDMERHFNAQGKTINHVTIRYGADSKEEESGKSDITDKAQHASALQELTTKVAASIEAQLAELSEESMREYWKRLRVKHGLEKGE
jgi:hypothetical protein